jgi:hypothetical protein
MKFSASFLFGPGRSAAGRGAIALLAAPVLMTIPLALLIYLSSLHGGFFLPAPGSAIHSFVGLATAMIKLTLLFGIPTWAVLRLIRRESGLAYALAGLAWGVLAIIWLSYAFRDGWSADQVPNAIFAGLSGACIAATFWSIARDPTTKEAQS